MSKYEYSLFVLPHRGGPDPVEQLSAIGCQPDTLNGETIVGSLSTTDLDEAMRELEAIADRFDRRPGYVVHRHIFRRRFTVVAHEGDVYHGAGAIRATWFIARRLIEPSAWEPVPCPD